MKSLNSHPQGKLGTNDLKRQCSPSGYPIWVSSKLSHTHSHTAHQLELITHHSHLYLFSFLLRPLGPREGDVHKLMIVGTDTPQSIVKHGQTDPLTILHHLHPPKYRVAPKPLATSQDSSESKFPSSSTLEGRRYLQLSPWLADCKDHLNQRS